MPTVTTCDSCGSRVTARWSARVELLDFTKRAEFCSNLCALNWMKQEVQTPAPTLLVPVEETRQCSHCKLPIEATPYYVTLSPLQRDLRGCYLCSESCISAWRKANASTATVCILDLPPARTEELSGAEGKDEKPQ